MKAMALRAPISLDQLAMEDRRDPGEPGPGEIRVALHGSSLNFHDLGVATGRMPAADGRIPLADGAGIVEAIGPGVTDFAMGDMVVSCFFPDWQDGAPTIGDFSRTPGDGIDGFAQEVVVLPATAFTHAPKGYDAVEAATITTAGLTAWRALVVDGGIKAGDTVLLLGTGGVSIWALQLARLMGATVAITSSSGEKLERARDLGATFTLNYREQQDWGRVVRDLSLIHI
ncbi:NAD(P)-dependent alcohol dehydrogenase [uncultured Sphingomonas sp.]|uniref:zinc-dependent alcohol dehydrogenase family protein n=1 Tax=uncultured Sphingomonas sp. TaxID=158754 RepID=UPI00345DFAB8